MIIMKSLNEYRALSQTDLSKLPIVSIYKEVINGNRKSLPKGTWEEEENFIILLRYVLEVHLGLSKQEIPKISRSLIKEQKLWGALNRFKSVPSLIQFVYAEQYNEFDFSRVPVDYWKDIQNIKNRLEWYLNKEELKIDEIPMRVDCEFLINRGLSNPLKRFGHSPFQLINALYPGMFKEIDFKKIPHRYAENKRFLREQFFDMLKKENIPLEEAPRKITQQMLVNYRFSGALKHHEGSPSKFILSLFPNLLTINDFHTKPNGYWKDIANVRQAIEELIKREEVCAEDVPKFITKKKLKEEGLYGLLHEYKGSPIEIVNSIFPGKYDITEFQRVPNKYWHSRKNRIEALRTYCKKRRINRESLPLLNRAYFQKHFPRFISMVDRHYDSKFYQWIIEAFPEYTFSPEKFNLLVGIDGQTCDSKEEQSIHNFLIYHLGNATVIREGRRFTNKLCEEAYIPDWIIQQNQRKFIVEYFGLYGSDRYKTYEEKARRKIAYYEGLEDYEFICIMPEDFRRKGFNQISSLLEDKGIRLSLS